MPKAKNLLYLRKKAGLSQERLAEELGVTIVTVRSWEHKKTAIPVPATRRIARYFGVSFSDFCDTDLAEVRSLKLTDDEMTLVKAYRRLPCEVQDALRYLVTHQTE